MATVLVVVPVAVGAAAIVVIVAAAVVAIVAAAVVVELISGPVWSLCLEVAHY